MKIYCSDNWDAYNFTIKLPKTREIGKQNTQDIERSVNFVLNYYNHQLL